MAGAAGLSAGREPGAEGRAAMIGGTARRVKA
jgi:hypothetical protein